MLNQQREILRLYRDLLRYSRTLKYTDVEFYFNRIRQEFARNKTLTDENEIFRQMAVRFSHLFSFVELVQSFRKEKNF